MSLLVSALHGKSDDALRQRKEIVSSLRKLEIIDSTEKMLGHAVGYFVEAPCYKPERHGFKSESGIFFFS
jgi:hypothetical protein